MENKILQALNGDVQINPPYWLMRQAGRYLPEYREVRAKTSGFFDLCFNPELACEVTLQPIRRYGMNAAILFSDILVIPHCLGQSVRFLENHGPVLEKISSVTDLNKLSIIGALDKLQSVFTTIKLIKSNLDLNTSLLGFAGCPWTLACYMIDGGSSKDWTKTRLFAYNESLEFSRLIELLSDVTVRYLSEQISCGVDAVQLFDTWAGILPYDQFLKWVINPTKNIIQRLRQIHPNAKVIGFPRCSGQQLITYINETGVDCISIDTSISTSWAKSIVKGRITIQGNLDPHILIAGNDILRNEIMRILDSMKGTPYIFNLGHGILPQTPVDNVKMIKECIDSLI